MKKWILKEKSYPQGNSATKALGIDENIGNIMLNREISTREDIKMYINPSLKRLRDPFLLKGMEESVKRIEEAIKNKEKICIYGDYDVDGVSSTSILKIYFQSINYQVDYYIPNRLEEGYGLNEDAIKHLSKRGYKLIITVDCGIASFKEVCLAKDLNMDIIITDHHECQGDLPKAYAIINPKQADCKYPFKGLCGCGVVFKLIQALSGEKFQENIYKYLEIVALATICDVMPILDENRIIVKNALEIMGSGNNLGMRELVKVCGLDKRKIKSSHLGFAIGPRINASGRLGFSNLGVELFTSSDFKEAEKIAYEMNIKNQQRQEIEARIYQEAEEMLSKNQNFNDDRVLLLAGENWHHGIIGIVASKLTEKYYKPTILLCIDGQEAVGSARSIKGFDMFAALFECREYMEKFGGHEQAAGLTVKTSDIDSLREKINKIADYELELEDLIEEIKIEYEIDENIVDLDFVDKLHTLEPFGIKNPTPYFLMRNCFVKNSFLMGKEKNHLKINIEKGREFECIGFGQSHLKSLFNNGDWIDIVFQLDENTFNGNTKLQLLLKDIRLSRPRQILNYPKDLKNIYDAPKVIFYKGDISNIGKNFSIGVVGSRKPTGYGVECTKKITRELSEYGINIISGLAIGIDAISHETALLGNGKTFGILGSGIDNPLPKTNIRLMNKIVESGGAVISEHGINKKVLPYYFAKRNRIISGLSEGVIVIEAAIKSGALITAEFAAEQGRTVFAVPGSLFSENSRGCHKLIKDGAKLTESIDDILEEFETFKLKIIKKDEKYDNINIKLSEFENIVIDIIKKNGTIDIDSLCSQSKIGIENVNPIIEKLKLYGLIFEIEKGVYSMKI